jgi:hypothetical protein
MAFIQKIKVFDTKISKRQVRLRYNAVKKSVRIVCKNSDDGAVHLRNLITNGNVGLIDAVIYSARHDSKIISLIRGATLDKFLRSGTKEAASTTARKKTFSQIAKERNISP